MYLGAVWNRYKGCEPPLVEASDYMRCKCAAETLLYDVLPHSSTLLFQLAMTPTLRQALPHARSRRAANNNYQKLTKTLYQKLTKLCLEYNAQVYFLAYRNGRFSGFMSADEAGQPWLPPSQEILVRLFFIASTTTPNGCKGENVPPTYH